jgi:PAS domain S-box-containing protein
LSFPKKYFLPAVLVLLSLTNQAQTKTDSLKKLLSETATEIDKVQLLHQLYLQTDSVSYAEKAHELAEKNAYKAGLVITLADLGRYNYFRGKEEVALNFLIKAKKIGEEVNDKKTLISVFRYIGFIYRPHDPYKAKQYYESSLELCNETGNELAGSYAFSAIGNIYEGLKGDAEHKHKALDYYNKSLAIREKLGSASEVAASLNETSRAYDAIGDFAKAEQLRLKGLKIAEESGDKENIVYLCNVLGNNFAFRNKDYNKALTFQKKAFDLAKSMENKNELLMDISRAIGDCYLALGKQKDATEFFSLSFVYNDALREKTGRQMYSLSSVNQVLERELEEKKLLVKDLEIAREKSEVARQRNLRNLFVAGFALVIIMILLLWKGYKQKLKVVSQLDVKNKEVEIANATLVASENKFKQITETIHDVFYLYNIVEKKYEYVSPNCGEVLGIDEDYFYTGKSTKAIVHPEDLQIVIEANVKVDSGIAYDIEYRINYRNEIRWIAEKSSPIFENRKLVRNSGICRDITRRKKNEEAIRKHDKELTDSIHVAKTIQDAILVPKEKMASKFKEFFILSKPKEIVSGDFYFYKETKKGIFVAVADCTGHGVPAGFMSMIGNAFLIEVINANELISPAEALNALRSTIIHSLHQNDPLAELKDGMDIALVYFDKKFTSVQYAGAFNPMYLIRGGELIETEADQFPIGTQLDHELSPFKNHSQFIQKKDIIYLFSDGFSDQLGGDQGRKFGKVKMKELLVAIKDQPLYEQEISLAAAYDEWRGNEEQVDDVMVVGMKI